MDKHTARMIHAGILIGCVIAPYLIILWAVWSH